MSTTFRLFKSGSTAVTVSRSRAGVAAQKSCKRKIHVASSTSSSTTTTQLPGTGTTFSSSTGTLLNSEKLRSLHAHASHRTRSASSSAFSAPTTSSKENRQESWSETSVSADRTPEELAHHLNETFGRTLVFPPELATRLLTHASHPVSKAVGHNMRFSFVGRRVLGAYFLTFLHSCPNVNSGADYSNIASNALNTYTLGEHVGREWGIGRVLRWRYMVDPQMIARGVDNRHIGLHKVLGTTVEAIVGGVYHQFGAAEAHKFFHIHLLPHILLKGTPQGVPDVYHSRAMQLYKSANGDANLSSPSPPTQ